ncbi:MAG: hypothetical protein EA393_14105 [Bacteroidetes bacterium]|nr:MAG: hypothetical protein EA393_14105 [Bacteroidota bacterium]
MRKIHLLPLVLLFLFAFTQACQQAPQETYEPEWLGETKQEIINTIEDQFQGFSRTMVEVGYRYQELYWAGIDENWEYAEYQREHIEEAMEQGFIRRPAREASSQQFISVALPEMEEIIRNRDKDAFLQNFTRFTASCNTCHAMEDVAFMIVKVPEKRYSVIHY